MHDRETQDRAIFDRAKPDRAKLDRDGVSRRRIIQAGGIGLAAGLYANAADAASFPRNPTDIGGVTGGRVTLPPISDPRTEPAQKPAEPPLSPQDRVGFAVVGLGRLSLEQIIPAFSESRNARLVSLVSGSPDKLKVLGSRLGLRRDALYSYDDFDRVAQNPEIKVVYIVLPNALHHEFVIRAAKAGKHVLCEKPMAVSSHEAGEMVEACTAAKVQLMVAYGCQYEKTNRYVSELARSQHFGPVKLIEAVNAQNQGDPAQWRLKKALSGGGPLPDIGLYCLNTIRAITGEEPVEIEAEIWSTPNDPRFTEVEEAVTWLMRFPSGLHATCATHYGVHKSQTLIAHAPAASLTVENAFAYRGQKLRVSSVENGTETEQIPSIKPANQFALELDHMAECVLANRKPRTPGEEGEQDHRLMEAIYQSAASRSVITVPPANRIDAFRGQPLEALEP